MKIIDGGSFIDNRGRIRFANEFDMKSIRRFYTIDIPDTSIIRAWQGHKKETKYFFVQRGSFLVGVVQIDNWESPSEKLMVETITLSETESRILVIEGGYANGFKALEANSSVTIFSDMTIAESKNDDFRFPPEYWRLEL
ncbi:MAG: dTDP-4-dehydrorhamnose 3,5-epimerase family protein [Salinivirgaceae bacterium]|nr:dTDP-4-dehydrorhamnose 3,5-epimerase family protein [Salinivirgaceae bacterium]MDY0279355.1 dTDP-4-dehydrorhamnose 3,5-epimerase family protein [Salinivirgaceae bacterium]